MEAEVVLDILRMKAEKVSMKLQLADRQLGSAIIHLRSEGFVVPDEIDPRTQRHLDLKAALRGDVGIGGSDANSSSGYGSEGDGEDGGGEDGGEGGGGGRDRSYPQKPESID